MPPTTSWWRRARCRRGRRGPARGGRPPGRGPPAPNWPPRPSPPTSPGSPTARTPAGAPGAPLPPGARHPNFAAVLVVGLGCEANQIPRLVQAERLTVGERLVPMTIQETGGTAKTVQRGVDQIRALLPEANRVERRRVPASHIVVGLQ